MPAALAACILLMTALDHWTTYLCLHRSFSGWLVTEGNPLAAWVFDSIGLVPGLALDSAVTLGAIAFVLRTRLFSRGAKLGCLLLLLATTSLAVFNNLDALSTISIGIGS